MNKQYETERRLKDYIDTFQLSKERLSRALLELDKRFTNITPHHPRGGRDGGIDIEATFNLDKRAAVAVGFINQASDTKEQKKSMDKKFKEDLRKAIDFFKDIEKLSVFVFVTNINFTVTERNKMVEHCQKLGVDFCFIYDRERITGILNTIEGLFLRLEFLDIEMNKEEQLSFFSNLNTITLNALNDSHSKTEKKLDQLIFWSQKDKKFDSLFFKINFKKEVRAGEYKNPLVLFVVMQLIDLVEEEKVADMYFGSVITAGKYFQYVSDEEYIEKETFFRKTFSGFTKTFDIENKLIINSTSSGLHGDYISRIFLEYNQSSDIFRFPNSLTLLNIDKAKYIVFCDTETSKIVSSIEILTEDFLIESISYEDNSIVDIEDENYFTNKIEEAFNLKFEEAKFPTINWSALTKKDHSFCIIDYSNKNPKAHS